ncbi:MAG TPA: aspartate aminotransferase family protein [Bryobacteraceae bacterium]|jgi:L-2,4-diaminobutyrate decarboxylase
MFESDFFSGRESGADYLAWVAAMAQELIASYPEGPYAGDTPTDLSNALRGEILPSAPTPIAELTARIGTVIRKSIAVSHPNTAAHLHTPVLLPALAAEMVVSALNQSMDSFDQAPAATVIEELVCDWLCRLAGLPPSAGGTFTAGGTQSNYMGLLLARDHFLSTRWKWNARENGLPQEASRLRIFCSEAAHFSVEKAAIQLGLGLRSVVRIETDDKFRMRPDDLARRIESARREGLEPMAVAATSGTTDFGSFDPLDPIAEIARAERLWLHVDAAYGGALLLSNRRRGLLDALDRADSITIDFHKAFFQPISCGAFLLSDRARFDFIRLHADYLNTEEREADGIPDLVVRSVLTTRRFDALKLWVSLQAVGRERFAAMIDRLGSLAEFASAEISRLENFELLNDPEFGCVVFRYAPREHDADADAINRAAANVLFDGGRAVLGHTTVKGHACLKLTFCNPRTSEAQVRELLKTIAGCCRELAASQSAEALIAHA